MRELTDEQQRELRTNPRALADLANADRLRLLERRYPMVVGGVVTRVPYSVAKGATTYGAGYCVSERCRSVQDEDGFWMVRSERGSWLCVECTERLRKLLGMIDSSWEMLEELLLPGAPKGGERVSSGNTGSPAPLDVNVADVMSAARGLVWSLVEHLIEDLPGKRMPADQSTPSLAGWLGRYHVQYFASHPEESLPQALLPELDEIVRSIRNQIFPTGQRRLDIPTACAQVRINEKGKRVTCGGQMFAYVRDRADGRGSEVQCMEDPAHTIQEHDWLGLLKAKEKKAGKR